MTRAPIISATMEEDVNPQIMNHTVFAQHHGKAQIVYVRFVLGFFFVNCTFNPYAEMSLSPFFSVVRAVSTEGRKTKTKQTNYLRSSGTEN